MSSSDTSGLPGTTTYADAHAILRELAEYLPFRPGTRWGESPDIDWEHTKYESNADSQLFINQTGTDAWRPDASSSHIANIYLAGDFCNNNIGMTTIESAVTTGLEAAKVIVGRNGLRPSGEDHSAGAECHRGSGLRVAALRVGSLRGGGEPVVPRLLVRSRTGVAAGPGRGCRGWRTRAAASRG